MSSVFLIKNKTGLISELGSFLNLMVLAVHEVFDKLDYDEQYMVANRLGFCMNCFSDYYIDNTVTDKDGNPKKVKFKKMTYLDLANTFGKSSPDTAYQTVHRATQKCVSG